MLTNRSLVPLLPNLFADEEEVEIIRLNGTGVDGGSRRHGDTLRSVHY